MDMRWCELLQPAAQSASITDEVKAMTSPSRSTFALNFDFRIGTMIAQQPRSVTSRRLTGSGRVAS
jgi:hypothetical protein